MAEQIRGMKQLVVRNSIVKLFAEQTGTRLKCHTEFCNFTIIVELSQVNWPSVKMGQIRLRCVSTFKI